jgi:hypothetical protein
MRYPSNMVPHALSAPGLCKSIRKQGGKICFDAVLRTLSNPAPCATPTANSACYSPLSSTVASGLTAFDQYEQQLDSSWKYVARDPISTTTGLTEAASASTGNFTKMNTWYKTLMTETYS